VSVWHLHSNVLFARSCASYTYGTTDSHAFSSSSSSFRGSRGVRDGTTRTGVKTGEAAGIRITIITIITTSTDNRTSISLRVRNYPEHIKNYLLNLFRFLQPKIFPLRYQCVIDSFRYLSLAHVQYCDYERSLVLYNMRNGKIRL
jgi:hypothetical protein